MEVLMKAKAKGCGGILLLFVLLPTLMFTACSVADRHPSDAQMRAEMAGTQQDYFALLEMVRAEPRVSRVAHDFIRYDGLRSPAEAERTSILTDARWRRYRALFTKLKLESGVIRYEDGSVGFLRSSRGLVTAGSSKEFVWSPDDELVTLHSSDPRSLEDACAPRDSCEVTRRIAPHWYIRLERH